MSLKIPRQAWLWYVAALIVLLLDQFSKMWISERFTFGESYVLTSFFNFTLWYNEGAAFSFLANQGGWQRWFFSILASGVSVALVVWIARIAQHNRREAFALSFILGGALGNLYDRIVHGHVIDFIVVHYQNHYWPAFNLADSAITLGAIVLIADLFLKKENLSNA
jgi:signal peptidase II